MQLKPTPDVKQLLERTADVRWEMVEFGRSLIADMAYPSREIEWEVAQLLAANSLEKTD